MVTGGYKGLQGVKRHYRELQEVTRSYRKLHVQGVRGGYREQQDITRGYRGKRILLHCRGPYTYKRLQGKRVPPPPPLPDKGKTERGNIYERLERGERRLQGVSKSALHFSRSSFSSF